MKVPKVTGILAVTLISLSILNFVLKYYTYFVLVVSSVKNAKGDDSSHKDDAIPHPHELFVPFLTFIPTKSPVLVRPWVIITSSFIEPEFYKLGASVMIFFYLGKYLENLWGTREFIKFILTDLLIPNLCIYLYYTSKAAILKTEEYPPVVVSATAIIMGFLIAIKQRISNHYFLLFQGNLRIKVTWVPFLLLCFLFTISKFSEEYKMHFELALCGFFISWIYLRFLKLGSNDRNSYLLPLNLARKNSSSRYRSVCAARKSDKIPQATLHIDKNVRGDRSEQFSFYTLFPYPLSHAVKFISLKVFHLFVRMNLLHEEDFPQYDLDDDSFSFEEMKNLQTKLFDLSSLKGAEDVSAIPKAKSLLRSAWNWVTSKKLASKTFNIKSSMDKRRKLALKELE